VEFLTWLSNNSLITWVRESDSLLGYTLYLAFHTIGMVMLVGPTLLIAARVLGLAPALPLKPLGAFRPFMTIGLWITIVTGTVLFATAPVGYVQNIVFIVKITAIVLAVGCLRAVLRELFSRGADADAQPVSVRAKTLTAATVALWLIGVVAGRLTAYSGIVVVASIGAFAALVVVAVLFGTVVRVIRIRPEPAFVPHVHAAPVKGGK
jgi:hypothetical protein